MITFRPTKDQIRRAIKLYSFDELNGSITKGSSNKYGALGEIIVIDFLNTVFICRHVGNYNYDILASGLTIEVKTKRTTVKPQDHYYCSISAFNTKQECNYYIFCRVREDFSEAYILGYLSKKEFFNKAVYKRKGDLDTDGFVFKDDCYNVPIGELKDIRKLIDL